MTRRGLFGALLAVAAVRPTRKTYGLMTYERWKAEGLMDRGAIVLLNGVDVTKIICACHDEEGWADHQRGQRMDGTPIMVRLRGPVEIRG